MHGVISSLNSTTLEQLKNSLLSDKLQILPTETVYGLAANSLSDFACSSIYKAKNRPQDNPLIIHFSSFNQVSQFIKADFTPLELLIFENFMPGSVTLLKNFKSTKICKTALSGSNSICIRIPENKIIREIISYTNLPLAAPSANKSGRPSCTNINSCLKEFEGTKEIDFYVDGGECNKGLESTIIRVTDFNTIEILRKGATTKENLESKLTGAQIVYSEYSKEIVPGAKYKHYSPNAEVYILGKNFKDRENKLREYIKSNLNSKIKTLILVTENIFEKFSKLYDLKKKIYKEREAFEFSNFFVICIGKKDNLTKIGKKFYGYLTLADEMKCDKIIFEEVDNIGLGSTIMERLRKSANGKYL